jgi:membrane-associated phospholipid phosphatase
VSKDTEPVATRDGPVTPPPGAVIRKVRRQRRPTGAPPPMPRPTFVSTAIWLTLVVVALTGATLSLLRTPWLRLDDQVNTAALRHLAGIRTAWLTDLANGIKVAGGDWGVTALGLIVVALTALFRRWRHLLVFLCSLFFLEIVGQWIYHVLSRPRPYGVPIIADWGGYSAPSPPVSVLTVFLVGAAYCLAVPGRPRTYAKAAAAVLIAVFCLARLYLGLDHLDDVFFGVVLAVAIPVTAFRLFTPN